MTSAPRASITLALLCNMRLELKQEKPSSGCVVLHTSMSSNPQPNTKRKREGPINDDAPREVERSTQFWFDDGNVVLQTQTMQFRVHRSLLSLHSPIMKDCFACPQPGNAPTLEGCPLVHLPDPTKDIENFCALIYGVYQCVLIALVFSRLIRSLLAPALMWTASTMLIWKR